MTLIELVGVVRRWFRRDKQWRVLHDMEDDPFGKTIPKWATHLAILGYGSQGWRACDQTQGGKTVATLAVSRPFQAGRL